MIGIFIGTAVIIWIAFYINDVVFRANAGNVDIFSWSYFLPGVILGSCISFVWFVFLEVQFHQPIKKITSITENIAEYGADKKLHESINDAHFPNLTASIRKLSEKLQKDQQSFRRMEKVRSEFLGNVSHELRTPIFALQGFIETLLGGAVDDPEVNRKFLDRAFHQTTRLNNLLSDLIEISRIESGEMKLSLRYFDVHQFLQQLVEEMQPIAMQRNIALKYELRSEPSDVLVLGDRNRLKQVFENLIENAVKYNFENGAVTVVLSLKKTTAQISVIDTGLGIPEEQRQRIFERFYRIDKDRSRAVGGSGLGLAIVKHIVLAHKGQVEVGETKGGGSTFTVTLQR